MYILDTHVVSELRKARAGKAHHNVTRWATGVPASSLFVSVITILELELGVLLLERRDDGRVLSIDTPVALECASLHVPDPHAERDALIAATARVHCMTVVTRNVSDFAMTGVDIFDPWASRDPATRAVV